MTRLIPEKRVDRNGKIVTRHIRTNPVSTTTAIPNVPPEKDTAAKSQRPSKKQLESTFHTLYNSDYPQDPQLVSALNLDTREFLRFSVNDIEFADVISVTSEANAIGLMAGGIRTAEQAKDVLTRHGLGHLIEDNSWEASELIKRRVTPLCYIEMKMQPSAHLASREELVDAAEAHSIKALRGIGYPTFPVRVLDGAISIEDIRTVGATRLIRSDPYGSVMIPALVRIKAGESRYNASDLRLLIEEFSEKETEAVYDMDKILKLAQRHGAEYVCNLYSPDTAFNLIKYLGDDKDNEAASEAITSYVDNLLRCQAETATRFKVNLKDAVVLYHAGVDYKAAARGLADDNSVNQIIAIHKEGITASVSGGWL